MPRRGGLTTTRSGAAGWASAHAVASPATKADALGRRRLRGRHRLGRHLHAGDRATRSGDGEGEAADAAVEVPGAADVGEAGHPVAGLGVERGGDVGVGLEEALRAQRQLEPLEPHRQRRLGRQHDLALALEHGRVRGLHVERDHPQGREGLQQPREVLADPRLVGGRAHHQPQHQLAVRRLGEQHVLELAAARRHVVRREVGAGDERGDHLERGRQPGGVQPAVAQVDPGPGAVEDPQRRRGGRAADRHLGLVAEARVRTGHRRQPAPATGTSERACASLSESCCARGTSSRVQERQRCAS